MKPKVEKSEHVTTTTYANGSYEVHHNLVSGIGWIVAPNPFGGTWTINLNSTGIHNQSTGNPDGQGIHRRGRKWYPHFDINVGWTWR